MSENHEKAPAMESRVIPQEKETDLISAFPASYQQQQLWFLHELDSEQQPYNIPLAYELHGSVNLDALDESFQWVVNRHEALRTIVTVHGVDLVQAVEEAGEHHLERRDLSRENSGERERLCEEQVAEESCYRFRLSKGPLVRGIVIKLDEERHVLVFNFHHIILDHLSVLQFSTEFCHAYEAFSAGKEPQMEEPRLHYPDFSVWQKEETETPAFQEELKEWVGNVGGAETAGDLPFDRPRPLVQTFAGEELRFEFSEELSEKVREFARSSRKTPYVMLLTVFKCLLARYLGQSDVTVGSPFANRMAEELDGVMGCCMNTLPLRSDLGKADSFSEAMDIVQSSVSWTYRRQRVPLRLIAGQSKVEHESQRNPFFQTSFMFQDPPMSIELSGLGVIPLHIHNGTSKFDMAPWMWDSNGRIGGLWEYNTDLFDRKTMERIIANFETLVESAIANPGGKWLELPIVSDSEFTKIASGFNDTNREYDVSLGIRDRFESQVRENPDKTALVFQKETLTYAALDARAEALASELESRGVGPGTLVAVYLDRSIELPVTLLAILKTEAGYLPLDPVYPAERVGFMLEDAAPVLLVTTQELASELPDSALPFLALDDFDFEQKTERPQGDVKRNIDDLAYIRYTSGSTGKPKGVEISHGAILNFLLSMQREPGFGSDDVLLMVTTIAFDISELELWLPFITGGKVVLADSEDIVDGEALAELIKREGITVMQATPATWKLLLDSGWKGSRDLKVLCGGEELPSHLAERLLPKCGELWNMYGPTETTVWSSVLRIDSADQILVGGPIDNTEFQIVDETMHPVPIGVFGELLIGGDSVARGYRNREELTAEKFISHPSQAGQRLYRTGDLVRWREDGTIQFAGRIDTQVKIRGYRVELGEIETVLRQVDAIQDAVVTIHEDSPGNPRLVGYLVANAGQGIETGELREFVRGKLPEYMVPAAFVVLGSFPLTPNGKVDRKSLPAPSSAASESETRTANLETETEKRMAEVWAKTLNVSSVEGSGNFFDLGGHSLSAVQLALNIERAFEVKMPLRKFMKDPTLSAVSRLVDDALQGGETVVREEVLSADSSEPEMKKEEVSEVNEASRTEGVDEEISEVRQEPKENLFRGMMIRVLQVIALYAPGFSTFRVRLHRWRGVKLGQDVTIGTGALIETAFPELVSIGNNVQIGIRSVFIGHFGESTDKARLEGRPTITVEDDVYIGPGVLILPNVTIGQGAVLTAGTVVHESIPPNTVVQGNPAKPVARCGIPLAGNHYSAFVANLEPLDDSLQSVL